MANNSIEIKTENPSPHFWFFIGLTAKDFRQNAFAINAFEQYLIADKTRESEKVFGANSALQQLVELYITENQLIPALKIADTDKSEKSSELLDLLSKTAESIGEFQKAIEFEKSKESENISAERIKILENLDTQKNRKVTDFVVNTDKTRKL